MIFTGSIPNLIGNLSNLNNLNLGNNRLSGTLTEQQFWKLSNLEYLYIDSNSFRLDVSSNWTPPFQLQYLVMGSCHIGPAFPAWLSSQKYLMYLDLSNASISSSIPNWFWNIFSNLEYVILSHNQLQGHLPNSNIGEFLPNLHFLSLSSNLITGTIPNSIGHLSSLEVIDFSSNNLTGSIPSTINNCSDLMVLDLGNNSLSGRIPKSLGQLQLLKSLHLNRNKLSGEIPSSLQNLTSLDVLDLSYNNLSGQILAWIGTTFANLVILNLRSNMFSGKLLPSLLSNLSSLHVLDLAQNNMSGEIPVTLVELKAMTQERDMGIYSLYGSGSGYQYEERLIVITKGQILEYTRALSLVVSIDLSDNNLSGELPKGMTKLFGLVFLNLSMNHITGQIPESISKLRQLSSLDLSSNNLFGSIPSSMSSLSFLGYLNLSNNNFSGKIPFIGHMSTFTDSAFTRNPNLCGAPLVIKCQDEDLDKRQSASVEDKIDGGYVDQWFYLSIGLGFAMGILGPYFVLAMKRSWCDAYFDFVDKIVKWLVFRRIVTYARNHAQRQ